MTLISGSPLSGAAPADSHPAPGRKGVPGTPATDDYRRRAVRAAAIGYGVDGFDLLVLAFAVGGIMASFHASAAQAAFLTTLTLLGALTGGLTFGVLADRLGRIRVLSWSILVFAVFTGLCSIAPDMSWLRIFRFFAGVGLGGEFGIGMTLAAEAVAARRRARTTSWVAVGFQLGALAAALLSAPILSVWGWRGLFAVGTAPALVAFFLRRRLPESPAFSAGKPAGSRNAIGTSLRALVATPTMIRTTVAIIVMTSVQNFGYYGIMTWLPHYLGTERGLGVGRGDIWTSVTALGMLAGILAFGQLADRVGRRPAFWTFQLGAAASVLVYSRLTDPTALLVGGFVLGIFANGMLGGYGALIAERYPTAARASAENILFNIGRGVGGFGPVVMATLAAAHGFGHALALFPFIYLLAFAATLALPKEQS